MPRLILLFVLLLALPVSAHADPITVLAFVASAAGTAGIISVGTAIAINIGLQVFGAYRARRSAKKAAEAARRAYNDSLKDRTVTTVQQEPPERYFYGEGITGGDVVAVFTSDKVADGNTKPDGLKHIVVVIASHRIKAIRDVLIGGVRLGITGMSGWATATEFSKGGTQDVSVTTAGGSATYTIAEPFVSVLSVTFSMNQFNIMVPAGGLYGYSLSGSTITLPETISFRDDLVLTDAEYGYWIITYNKAQSGSSTVYVEKFLGTADQTANAYLMSKVPTEWTSTDRLRGRAGVVITLDLEDSQFQGGIPALTFDIEGRDEIYDPRTGTTGYTNNAALCVDDWLRSSRWGFGVTPDVASTIVAANACDASVPMSVTTYPTSGTGTPTTTVTYLPRYTINGAISASDDKESVLSSMAAAMAGRVIDGADWYIQAGVWTPPVMDLVDGDEAGPIQIVQAGEAMDEIFNSVRATYIPAGQASVADLWPPYSNSAFITADGLELWEDMTLQFTDHPSRARNIARITTEVARNGLTISYPAKLKAWSLKVGDRVRITNAEYAWTLKHFRVTDWQFAHTGAVVLQLVEDDETAWDEADASVADPTPNSGLPYPYSPTAITGAAAESGTNWLLKLADGTIVPRVRVSWADSTSTYQDNGRIEVAWRTTDTSVWTVQNVASSDNYAMILGAPEFQTLLIRIVVINGLGVRSDNVYLSHYVIGKSAAPDNVTGLTAAAAIGGAVITWNANTETDYRDTELREGVSWAAGTTIFVGAADTFNWIQPVANPYTIWAKHRDTSGNESATEVSVDVTVVASSTSSQIEVTTPIFAVPATSAGVPTSYTGASSVIKVMEAGVDRTSLWTLSKTDGIGATSTLSAGTLTLTSLATATDATYIDVTATRSGYVSLTKRIVVTMVRAGATGATGSPGTPGTPGTPGSDGSPGSDGANGTRTAKPEVFQWAASAPGTPASTAFTYTWATGAVSAVPSGWTTSPSSSPIPGYNLYAATVTISNNATDATSTANWNTAVITVRGSSGFNGTRGTINTAYSNNGWSDAAAAYAVSLIAGGTPINGDIVTLYYSATGFSETKFYSAGSWLTLSAYINGNLLVDGTVQASKVVTSSLSALSANLGTVTAGVINGITINGTTITGGVLQTATSGSRIVLNESGSNVARFYGNGGGGVELLAQIGAVTLGSGYSVGVFGSTTAGNGTNGLTAYAYSGRAVIGVSAQNNGVYGTTSGGGAVAAVFGENTGSGYGAYFTSLSGAAVRAFSASGYSIDGTGPARITGTVIANDASGFQLNASGSEKGKLYFNSGEVKLESIGAVPVSVVVDGAVRATVGTAGLKIAGGLGCHGAGPQPIYTLPAASGDPLIDGMRQALINCGICQ